MFYKKILLPSCLFLLFASHITYGQDKPIKPTVEYASAYIKIMYQGNVIIYDEKGLSKSPLLYMPNGDIFTLKDYSDPENGKEFLTINQILNYMASYGWSLHSSNILPYSGGSGNKSTSVILNTNEFFQTLIFERPIKN